MKKVLLVIALMLLSLNNAFCEAPTPMLLKQMHQMSLGGNADVQFSLGFMYYHGDGVQQDYVEAMKWFKLAAAQGDADSQLNIGVM